MIEIKPIGNLYRVTINGAVTHVDHDYLLFLLASLSEFLNIPHNSVEKPHHPMALKVV